MAEVDAHEGVTNAMEAMVSDAADQQRSRGLIPNVNAVRKYLEPVLQEATNRQQDAKHAPKTAPQTVTKERSSADFEREYAARMRRKGLSPTTGSWTIERKPIEDEPPRLETLNSKRRLIQIERLRARMRLLRSKPDWAARLKTVNPLALQGTLGTDKQRHAEETIKNIIRDSERVFGPWMKGKAKTLYSVGTR